MSIFKDYLWPYIYQSLKNLIIPNAFDAIKLKVVTRIRYRYGHLKV